MRSRAPADAGAASRSTLSPIFPDAVSISLSTGAPLLPAGYHGISPVEIYKPLCGAIEVAPQGGFIVRMGDAIPIGEGDEDGAISDKKPSPRGEGGERSEADRVLAV